VQSADGQKQKHRPAAFPRLYQHQHQHHRLELNKTTAASGVYTTWGCQMPELRGQMHQKQVAEAATARSTDLQIEVGLLSLSLIVARDIFSYSPQCSTLYAM
jgi:hypothetical protein